MLKKIIFLCSLLFVSVFFIKVDAEMLKQYTNDTFVNNIHSGGLSDVYIGEVSVRGADWISENGYSYWPKSSKITYDVQGTISSRIVVAASSSEISTRYSTITVYDNWNFGPKTHAYYDIPLGIRWIGK